MNLRYLLLFFSILLLPQLVQGQSFYEKYRATLGNDIRCIAADDDSNIFVSGLGYPEMGCATNYDFPSDGNVFLVKLDAIGNVLWEIRFGGDRGFPTEIAVDSKGNAVVTGYFWDDADFSSWDEPDRTLTSFRSTDIFVAKVDTDGNIIWAKRVGGNSGDESNDIVIDDSDNIYITGKFNFTVNFGGGFELASFDQTHDPFVWALNSDGETLWAKNVEAPRPSEGLDIDVDNSGNIVATGTDISIGDFRKYVWKLSPTGNEIFYRTIVNTSDVINYDLATDSKDNIYLTGVFTDTIDFDPGSEEFFLNGGLNVNSDAYLLKLDKEGNFIWVQQTGEKTSYCEGKVISIDEFDNVFVTGEFRRTTDFDPGPGELFFESTFFSRDIYIQVIDSTGQFVTAITRGASFFLDFDTWDFEIDKRNNYYLGKQQFRGTGIANVEAFSNCEVERIDTVLVGCEFYDWNGNIFESDCYNSISKIDSTTGCETIYQDIVRIFFSQVPFVFIEDSMLVSDFPEPGQWLDCDNNYEPIPGATDYMFAPTETGNYAFLLIGFDSSIVCADTSDCVYFEVISSSVEDEIIREVEFYPNPFFNAINLANLPIEAAKISFFDLDGKLVFESLKPIGKSNFVIDDLHFPKGVYSVLIEADQFHFREMLLKL